MGAGSFEHLLEIARTHTDRQQASSLTKTCLGSAFPSLPCLPNRATSPLAYPYPFTLRPRASSYSQAIEGEPVLTFGAWGQPFSQLLGLDFASDKACPVDSRGAAQSQAQIVVWCHSFVSSRVRKMYATLMSKPGQQTQLGNFPYTLTNIHLRRSTD